MPIVFALTGGNTIARALGGEPRPPTGDWLQLAESAGRSGGLFLVGAGTARAIDLATMISLVAFGTLGWPLVLLALPETDGASWRRSARTAERRRFQHLTRRRRRQRRALAVKGEAAS